MNTNQLQPYDILPPPQASVQPAKHIPVIYFGISVKRLVCLFILTMGLYDYYWSYKNWKAIKKAEESTISPFWRSFWGILFCYSLFKRLAESVKVYSSKRPFSPTVLTWVYIILHTIGLGFLTIFILLKAQRAILVNNAHAVPNYEPIKQFNKVEVIWMIVGIVLWSFVIRGMIVNKQPKHANSWVTFQPESKDFSIQLPATPTYEAEQLPVDGTGLCIAYASYNSTDRDDTHYSVTRMVYPVEVPLGDLQAEDFVQDMVATSAGNSLMTSKQVKVGNHSAVDFLIKASYGYLKGRIVLVGQIKYLLMVAYTKEPLTGSYENFINSFLVKEAN